MPTAKENLYETLGIDPAATPAEVRKAYRKRAKKAHPDAGGDPAAFHALSRALRILDDPVKRAKYDAGEEPDDAADNAHSQMLSRIAELFAMVFANIEERGSDPALTDIMVMARKTITGTIAAKEKQRGEIERGIATREKLKGRFSGPPATVTLLEAMIDTPIRNGRAALTKLNAGIAEDREVFAFLSEVTWRVDKPEPLPGRDDVYPYSRHNPPPGFFDGITAEMLKQVRGQMRAGSK